MKKIILYFLFAFISNYANAKIWYVDPNVSSPLVLTDIVAAIDSANAGDTIMVKGSFWIQFAITKPLTLYGEGYNDISGNKTEIFGRLDITSSNVNISGFQIVQDASSFAISFDAGADSAKIERCMIKGIVNMPTGTFSQMYFRNNVFKKSQGWGYIQAAYQFLTLDTLIFENNIFDDYQFHFGNTNGTNTASIRNNTFINGAPVFLFDADCSVDLYNNIFYNTNPQGCTSCTYTYNDFWNDSIGYDTLIVGNNLNHINPAFEGYTGGSFDFYADYTLSDTSQCLTAGLNSFDIGLTGGYFPFTVGEGPKIPLVTYVNISSNTDSLSNVFYLQFDSRARTDVFYNGTLITSNDSVKLVEAEYWIDSIPPIPGTGDLITLSNLTDTIFYNDTIPILQLDTGTHIVSVRVKDSNGNWGFIFSDSVRNENYEVDISSISPPIIREGFKTKFIVTVTNRSTVDLFEQYIIMKASRDYNVEFESIADSINGVSVNNISKTILVDGGNPHYDMPLWIGNLYKQQSTSYSFYATFPSLLPHAKLNISFELLGSEKSDMQQYYEQFGTDTSIFLSLYAGSLLNSINIIKDTLGLDSLNYTILSDSLHDWLKSNNSLFGDAIPLNYIPTIFLNNCFGSSFSDSIINAINLVVYNIFKFSTYNVERNGSDTTNFAKFNNVQTNPDCLCSTPLNLTGQLISPPLLPTDYFDISSGCQKRCKCDCEFGHWQRVDEETHLAIDFGIREDAPESTKKDWYKGNIPVHSMFNGTIGVLVGLGEGGNVVIVFSEDNSGQLFNVQYAHLDKIFVEDGDTVIAGDVIGTVGRSGSGTSGLPESTHLHLGSYGPDFAPSCFMNFDALYQADLDALIDISCKPLEEDSCGYEIEGSCDGSIPFYYSREGTCQPEWIEKSECKDPESVQSNDPNSKTGNGGYASQRYIKYNDELHYGIFYENVDSATAPTQIAIFRDTLDLTKEDASTFYFESFTAGEMIIVLPDSLKLQSIDTTYMEEPINGTFVRVQASFDTLTGAIQIVFTSLNTFPPYDPVSNAWEGFLPPDTTDFHGNGLISFKVMPVSTIPDDTVIYNTAHIIFDSNPAIATGTWFNTIDRIEPTSTVIALPITTYDTTFAVHWTGTDDGAGIEDYDIYAKLSTDTAFTKWLSHTSLDSAMFTGVLGNTYQFYSIAYDSVGNVENKIALVEAFTTLSPVGIQYIFNSSDLKVYPNPTSGKLTIEATLEKDDVLNVEVFDLLSTKLFSLDVEGTNKKHIKREIDLSNQTDGVYLIRLNNSGNSLTKKFILKKN